MDRDVMALLDETAVSFALVLTKTDKLSADEVKGAIAAADAEARKHTAAFSEIGATSALKSTGLDSVKAQLAILAMQ
jgi:GTP-binding protein